MKRILRLLPGIGWFLLILYLLTLPGSAIPKAGWMDSLQIDKLVHIFLFFILVMWWIWGIVSAKHYTPVKKISIFLGIAALIYGIIMEFVQKFWIPNRSFDGWDILADGIGSFLPLLFPKQVKALLTRQKPLQ